MDIKKNFGKALKQVRIRQNLTQEDFSDVSSRTYISSLERGLKSVTLEKLDALAINLKVHPLTLLCLAYSNVGTTESIDELLSLIKKQTNEILHT